MKNRKPLVARSIRLPFPDVDAWHAAAAKLDISLSEFLRRAIRDKAHEVLDRSEQHGEVHEETHVR